MEEDILKYSPTVMFVGHPVLHLWIEILLWGDLLSPTVFIIKTFSVFFLIYLINSSLWNHILCIKIPFFVGLN